ncbi:protein serine/threonine kinase, putative [Entamoeba invadens IP1]|uniref:Protein serine/threonine kinase, putative n=1 Tax=Entamoeba invadens IP1 TaxID=370355 RepID=A0A0A1U6M5_ENTIV|nr:protein serine/threonine kinase, putative [Entamoeba invadens IP1]ELP89965.1 protein serine/threonine kinase, putative [Entamoeba invadens IP1]|eukprot:XP_004256736.1 protein serine/threonine kinase, putative [Entamoeba invadens IP1]
MVLDSNVCKKRLYIEHCVNVTKSLCEQCDFWHNKRDDKLFCDTLNLTKTLLIIFLGCVLVLIITSIVVSLIGYQIIHSRHLYNERKKKGVISVHDIKEPLNCFIDGIYTDSSIIDLGVDVPVNKTSTFTTLFANKLDLLVKLQLVYRQNNSYDITISPQVVTLRPNDACVFTIDITPKYSGDFDGFLTLSCVFLRCGIETVKALPLIFSTELSTWIDSSCISNMTEIGRGGNGTVYRGIYRDRVVAVKTMKCANMCDTDDEFTTEVDMLQKMRSLFVLEFVGAVLVGEKKMIVMEFIKNGNLETIIKKYTYQKDEKEVVQIIKISKEKQQDVQNTIQDKSIRNDEIKSSDEKSNVLLQTNSSLQYKTENFQKAEDHLLISNIKKENTNALQNSSDKLNIIGDVSSQHTLINTLNSQNNSASSTIGHIKKIQNSPLSLENLLTNHKSLIQHPHQKLSKNVRYKMLLDAAKGVEYLHTNGILHRDIKPGNILVEELENITEVNAKLSDFGSARNVNLLMSNLTFTRGVGTPSFMVPEILNGQKYSIEADVYALGITFFEAFAWEEACVDVKYFFEIAERVCKGERPKNKNLTEKEIKILEKMWAQNKHDRVPIEDVVNIMQIMLDKVR